MSKVTSKLQVTLPKVLADQLGIKPGDQIDWEIVGDVVRVIPAAKKQRSAAKNSRTLRVRFFDQATRRQNSASGRLTRRCFALPRPGAAGPERNSIRVAALVDTNILVYRFDPRFPEKQEIALNLLRRGIDEDSIRVPHQAVIEFVAAATRPLAGDRSLLSPAEARREAEEFLAQFPSQSTRSPSLASPLSSLSRNSGWPLSVPCAYRALLHL